MGEGQDILVVDDFPTNSRLLKDLLERANYHVRVQSNGSAALEAIRQQQPDLLLLDIHMPHMDGYEVCTRLKANKHTFDIPIIFISAVHDIEDKMTGFQVGGVDFITKPFQAEEVLARVNLHLRLHCLQKNLEERDQELLEARQQAEAANRAKHAFLANMSHELRTPLNIILGFTNILRQDPRMEHIYQKPLNDIYNNAQRLTNLLCDVLDLAKIEADGVELKYEDIVLEAFLQEIRDLAELYEQSQQLKFEYHKKTHLPYSVYSDPRRLRQILINLLGNAFKFTQQGSVKLIVGYNNGNLLISVKDTGIGINPTQIKDIFKPFTQACDVYKKNAGAGLGLAMCQNIVKLMQGKLQINSEPGQGSHFQVSIPIKAYFDPQQQNLTSNKVKLSPSAPQTAKLSDEQRKILQAMLKQGAIGDIVNYLQAQLKTSDYPEKIKELLELAENFEMHKIRQHL